MKRFTFSLSALLQQRQRTEEEVKLELAQKNSEIFDTNQEIIAVQGKLKDLQLDEKKRRERDVDALSLKFSVSYRNTLKLSLLKTGRKMTLLQEQLGQIRNKLVLATQQKKAIELIRDKKYREWLKEYRLREQVFIDDVSQQAFIRNHKATKD